VAGFCHDLRMVLPRPCQQRNDVIAPAASAAVADREDVTLGSGERSVPGGPYDGHVDRDDDNRDITAFSHVDDDADNTVLVVDLPVHVDHGC